MNYKKKLIEVALPLEAINRESVREKSIRYGHPSTLHLWWARRPLAACRAVIFASIVDDPSEHPDKFPTIIDQEKERQRLFAIIEELVKWKNSNNQSILEKARNEIIKYTGNNPLPFLDPFCGGGSIPLEAQRLGLKAYGSDLNPVAVLITKSLIEIPVKFSDMPPINPEANLKLENSKGWKGTIGLAEDVRYYGNCLRDEAQKKIGHLYPKVKLKGEDGDIEVTVIAWIWTRTVKCSNPACGCELPLTRTFELSKQKNNKAWVKPIINEYTKQITYVVETGNGTIPKAPKIARGAKFRCLSCGQITGDQYIKSEGLSNRIGMKLLAIIAEGKRGRIFLSPTEEQEKIANILRPKSYPDGELAYEPRDIRCPLYGLKSFPDLFTNRQLTALSIFSNLINQIHKKIVEDSLNCGFEISKANEYADAISTYLAFAVDRCADYWSSLTPWGGDFIVQTFSRQALPMVWDFAEANPFSNSTGSWDGAINWICKCLEMLSYDRVQGYAYQSDAKNLTGHCGSIISTDPPYYNNIGYADLSDYFYIWLRNSLKDIYPDLFKTMLVPKCDELVANPYRFDDNKNKAKQYFEEGLLKTFKHIKTISHNEYPITIFYAYKQTDSEGFDENNGNAIEASSGWETMLTGLISAGFSITGTWPIRTERPTGTKVNVNALASSIVLVCRKRPDDAPISTRREFITILRKELYHALKDLQSGNIAPVDLAQAAIGPGMSVFSRYSKILEADGNPMSVRTALQIINQELDAYFTSQEGDLDSDSRFCVAWYEQFGMNVSIFGEADVLARAKDTSVEKLSDEGVIYSAKGKVRLLKREELDEKWEPKSLKSNNMIWMCTQQLVKLLENQGEEKTAILINEIGNSASEDAKALLYRLYTIAERKGWAEDAYSYNNLVISWPDIQNKAAEIASTQYEQQTLY